MIDLIFRTILFYFILFFVAFYIYSKFFKLRNNGSIILKIVVFLFLHNLKIHYVVHT